MELGELMVKNVVTASKQDSMAAAAKRMRDARVGCLVVADGPAVQGIITDRDLIVRCVAGGHKAEECRISEHMSSPVMTAGPSMDILEAAHLLTEKQVKRLPVVEEGRLVGLVSVSDICRVLVRPMHDLLIGMGGGRRPA